MKGERQINSSCREDNYNMENTTDKIGTDLYNTSLYFDKLNGFFGALYVFPAFPA